MRFILWLHPSSTTQRTFKARGKSQYGKHIPVEERKNYRLAAIKAASMRIIRI